MNINKNYRFLLPLMVTAAMPFGAFAANYSAGVIDRQVPDVGVPRGSSLDDAQQSPVNKEITPKSVQDPNAKLAKFDAVSFEGNTKISDHVLQEIAEPYLHRVITKGELAELKYKLTKVYYDKGYILVKVTTPPQKVQNGTLKVNVYEAEVGNVIIDDPDNVVRHRIPEQMAKRVSPGEIVKEKTLESMISDINSLNNVGATLNLQPGSEFKTTDLHVALRREKEDVQRVTIDNYGSELTGDIVGTLHLEKSNLLKLGERFTADIRQSNEQLTSGKIGLETPIGIRNVILETSYLASTNDIGDRLAALDASGKTHAFNVALSSAFVDTIPQKIVGRVGLESREHKSYLAGILDTDDNIDRVYLNTTYLARLEKTVWYASATLSKGLDAFGASSKGDPLNSRALGEPEALRFEPLLLVNYRPWDNGTFKFVGTGQLSTNTLLSSDMFVIGGYGNVRGFEPAQESGENGYQVTFEYDHDFRVHPKLLLRAGPFFDMAGVLNRVQGSALDDHLYSAGLGAEARASLFRFGETFARVDWAHPLGGYHSNEVDDDSFYFQLGQTF
ncbi:MAG: ShlB/FhaC/HecB family hemolysin secretion/activation protein [Alphaproteobacteria bacterium]|nr:ShlB/FhaC/HecB family hemolysin secretion/activation protein [Alphaproteobacteria bacterium]